MLFLLTRTKPLIRQPVSVPYLDRGDGSLLGEEALRGVGVRVDIDLITITLTRGCTFNWLTNPKWLSFNHPGDINLDVFNLHLRLFTAARVSGTVSLW